MYAHPGTVIQRIDIRPVTLNHQRVDAYVFKTVLRGRLSYDAATVVLPRVRAESSRKNLAP